MEKPFYFLVLLAYGLAIGAAVTGVLHLTGVLS